jgi:ABC-type lipoprotein release transport system permease subunit
VISGRSKAPGPRRRDRGTGRRSGLAAAVWLSRAIEALLFGVRPFDAATLLSVAAVLGAMALLASWVPARRAMRLDPVSAMREE